MTTCSPVLVASTMSTMYSCTHLCTKIRPAHPQNPGRPAGVHGGAPGHHRRGILCTREALLRHSTMSTMYSCTHLCTKIRPASSLAAASSSRMFSIGRRTNSSCARDRYSPISFWRMRSTAPPPEPRPACWSAWRSARSPSTENPSGLLSGRGQLLQGQDAFQFCQGLLIYVAPDDIKALAVPVLAHRLVLGYGSGGTENTVKWMEQILGNIPVPTEEFRA